MIKHSNPEQFVNSTKILIIDFCKIKHPKQLIIYSIIVDFLNVTNKLIFNIDCKSNKKLK